MIATNDELALLEKWKRKLCLQEWRIKLLTHLHPEEMMVRNTAGCTKWSEAIKTARIEVITTVDVASTDSGGRLWYDFLERLGYYVPYEKRTKENDWYGKDMVLDNEQAKQLVDYAVKKEVYNWDGVESVVATALMHENKVVINAAW